jgi:hypothetical protein
LGELWSPSLTAEGPVLPSRPSSMRTPAMADWKKTEYAHKSWEQMQQEERDRKFEARFPTRWYDPWWIPLSLALSLLLLIGSLAGLAYFVLTRLF